MKLFGSSRPSAVAVEDDGEDPLAGPPVDSSHGAVIVNTSRLCRQYVSAVSSLPTTSLRFGCVAVAFEGQIDPNVFALVVEVADRIAP